VPEPRLPEQPPLRNVDPETSAQVAKGDSFQLGPNRWLFVPTGYRVPETGQVELTVYFNCDESMAREFQAQRRAIRPVVTVTGIPNSSQYQIAFANKAEFGSMLSDVAETLRRHGAPESARVSRVELCSYACGYAAVREILRTPEYVDLVSAVLLADSMYAAFENPGSRDRRPMAAHVEPFVKFARLAVEGRKVFVATHCQMVTPAFASTADTARYLVQQMGGELISVNSGPGAAPAGDGSTTPAGPEFPLVSRFDRGGLHVWGYAGTDERAHQAHLRGIGDFWRAIETP